MDHCSKVEHSLRFLVAACALAACGQSPEPGVVDTANPILSDMIAGWAPAPHPAWPQIPGSHVLAPLQVVAITSDGDPLGDTLATFTDQMMVSAWWRSIGGDYGLGDARPVVHVKGPALSGNLADADMKSYVTSAIAGNAAAAGDANTVYLFYLPPGVVMVLGTGTLNTDCSVEVGYHNSFFGPHAAGFSAVQRCTNTIEPLLDRTTAIASHEIAEAATDTGLHGYTLGRPPTVTPWSDSIWRSYESSGNVETGDLCEGTRIREGAFLYQRIWSNSAAARGGDPCAPAAAGGFFDVSAPEGWYALDASGSVTIPLTGWSTSADLPDWDIASIVKSASVTGFTVRTSAATHESVSAKLRATTNNGRAASVMVTAPAGAASGSYAVISVRSWPVTPSGDFVWGDSDPFHYWLVGVHVP